MLSHTLQLSLVKMLAIVVLAGGYSTIATGTEYFCNGMSSTGHGCSEVDSCTGTGWASEFGCDIQCYINGGQEPTDSGDCGEPLEG